MGNWARAGYISGDDDEESIFANGFHKDQGSRELKAESTDG
jgi:hypothetical protein